MTEPSIQSRPARGPLILPAASAGFRWGRWAAALGIALLLAGGTYALLELRPSLGKSSVRYETSRVDRGRIIGKVTATGTLSALVTVQVGSQVSGSLKEILADYNSEVTKGQVLARIDPRLFEANLEQAKANGTAANGNLAKARAQAVDAQRQYERILALVEKDAAAQSDADTAKANADVAKAQVEVAEGAVAQALAALHQAEVNLGYTTIVSPINGLVISRNVDVGQTVAASLQAPILFQIAEDLRRMQVDTSVAESDVGKLRAGMEATFTVEAYGVEPFRGTIRQVRYAPQIVQNVVTYDAVIDVENPDVRLKPGMTANVTFVHDRRDGVLRVPNAALRFLPSQDMLAKAGPAAGGAGGGEGRRKEAPGSTSAAASAVSPETAPEAGVGSDTRTVWVLRDGEPRPVDLVPGLSDGSYTEVLGGGLVEGDEVITEAIGAGTGGAGGKDSGRKSGSMRRIL